MVPSNSRVVPSPRTKMSFFLLSTSTNALLSTPKITTFLPKPKSGYEQTERELNHIPIPIESRIRIFTCINIFS